MKQRIIELRELGYSYNQIVKELRCSKGTVSYHLGKGVRVKQNERQRKRRSKVKDNFDMKLCYKASSFYFRAKWFKRGIKENSLSTKEIRETVKLQDNKCYLTGLPLTADNVSLDHIVPISKGGSGNKENLGLVVLSVNYMKRTLSVSELINYCELILLNYNYKIKRPSKIVSKVECNKGEYLENCEYKDLSYIQDN